MKAFATSGQKLHTSTFKGSKLVKSNDNYHVECFPQCYICYRTNLPLDLTEVGNGVML